jgi:multiple sugar transport system permease protein
MTHMAMPKSQSQEPKTYARRPRGETRLALALLAPCILILTFIIAYPLGRGLYLSTLKWSLIDPAGASAAGLSNYGRLMQDKVFWETLGNTLTFSLSSVAGGFLIGMLMAVLLNQNLAFSRLFRGLCLLPWIVPYVVVGFLFLYMFSFDVGVINFILKRLGLIQSNLPWLSMPGSAMVAVTAANIWNQIPFYMLMFLAGLQSVPGEVKEAAIIDGASSVGVFRYVTIPHLQGIMVITTILMLIRNFNNFPIIWTMTQGGPMYTSTTLVVYIFRLAFSDFNMGYAATVGIVWLVLLMVLTGIYVRVFEQEVAA